MNQLDPIEQVLDRFGLTGARTEPYGSGLINRTWKVHAGGSHYILQKINDRVFREPRDIAYNIRLIADYLQKHHPSYRFVAPVLTPEGDDLVLIREEGWFRLMPFVEGSLTYEVAETPGQAYEAARQFGRFTQRLSGFEGAALKITLPRFHDLGLRYQQFLASVAGGNETRKAASKELIAGLLENRDIVDQYHRMLLDPRFRIRVTHHDTKISNVLFDEEGKGICVIDLDTVMPGHFISDVGDMMRTYLSPVSEEEKEVDLIVPRKGFYEAVVEGYGSEMKEELTEAERGSFLFAGAFMTYMQALRFLTDYLNGDPYYGARYEGHNLVRARNQWVLLQRLKEMENRPGL